MLSRACQIATDGLKRNDATERRTRSIAHACCEGVGCECPCHRAEIELTCFREDPLPLISAQPGSTPLERIAA